MKLYALCDRDALRSRNMSLELFIQKAKKYNAKIIQYRNKNDDIAIIKKDLILLRQLYDGFLIINDYYELIAFCDGVHIGAELLPAGGRLSGDGPEDGDCGPIKVAADPLRGA